MTTSQHSADIAVTMQQAPPVACPPFRSTRPRRKPQGNLAVEDWGVARFRVGVQDGSAHEFGQIAGQSRRLADEGAAQAGHLPQHTHADVARGAQKRVVI